MPDSGEEPALQTANGAEVAAEDERDLDFRLVEIVDQDPIDPLPEVLEANPQAGKLDVNGKLGQVLTWLEESNQYLVETFDGDFAPISADHLKEYDPPAPEAGGFHAAMPRSEARAEFFPAELVELLESKLYCVIQATSTPEERKSFTRGLIEREEKWTRIMPDMEPCYMGQNPGGKKVLWLSHTDVAADNPDEEHGLSAADRVLTTLSGYLGPVCPSLGFETIHRTNAFVHARCANAKEEEELLEEFWEPTFKITAEEMQAHLSFKHRRKICMMYFVHGSGGKLTLHPLYRGWEEINITCQENQIVVFRHDLCNYTYRPEGKQLCVQAWLLRAPQAGEVGIHSADLTHRYHAEEIERIPDGPTYGTSAETVDCMSLACRYPGVIFVPEDYWSLLSVACDGGIRIPQVRWDHELYFDPNPESLMPGKAYAQHFGMLEMHALTHFEASYFGIPEEEAECIDPPARVMVEVGYDCLHRGGWDKKKLKGTEIGVCYGTAESEFAGMSLGGLFGVKKPARLGLMPACTSNRIQYLFGIKGPATSCETACSSALSATCVLHHWMRPMMPGQRQKRLVKQVPYAMAGGLNAAFNANTMIGFCGAHMLSIQGRCFTFDQSGDGFLRAEGIGAMHYKTSNREDHARIAMLVASQMNQDGRSASLTAPHGPSQQECIRYCLREANITALDVQVQELHGTGTALGDPIETGSLRATMMVCDGEVREHPIVKTSSKSNFGHTELNAGMCGIMKCALLGTYCAATPNCHIRLLNPHIDVNEYPVLFSSEIVDQMKDTAYCGVSSFGWSGCNARGDMWSRCLAGPRNTEPGRGHLDLSRDRIFYYDGLNRLSAPPEPDGPAGPALEDLEAYRGEYGVGMPGFEDNKFYCTGTFSGWSTMEEMYWLEERGAYAFAFALGEARVEQFQIVANKSDYYTIFPAAKMASSSALVLGPGMAPPGQAWAIDGQREGAKSGTVFMVFFTWDMESRMKRVWWEASNDDGALAMAATVKFRHSYSLVGTWTVWKPVKMAMSNQEDEKGVFEADVRIGIQRREEFRILRDGDPQQAFFPVTANTAEGEELQVRGPDFRHGDKKWEISGKMGDVVRIRFRAWQGEMSLSTTTPKGTTTWNSAPAVVYYVTATWNKYGFTAMAPDPKKPGVYTCRQQLTRERIEAFQIVVDQDLGQAIHPELELADQLYSQALGPDGKGAGLHWGVYGLAGTELKITLDLTQVEVDRRKVVTWSTDAPDVVGRREGLDPSADAPTFKTYDYE